MSGKKKNSGGERVSPEEYYALQQEETKRKYGVEDEPKQEGRVSKSITNFLERREARPKVQVKRKKYMLLMLLGMFGAHRFYAKQYPMALLYLATCWCGFSIAMTFIDLLIVIPMQPDENGNITL